MSELKKCPLCNKAPLYIDYSECAYEDYGHDAMCENEDCRLDGVVMSVDEWNNRPLEDSLKKLLKEIYPELPRKSQNRVKVWEATK